MTPASESRGLQFEVVASLLVLVLTGLSIVAIVMGTAAVRSVEEAALERLRMGARYGRYALGACGVLFALLYVGGVASLPLLCALAGFCLLERFARPIRWLEPLSGVALLVVGVITLVRPAPF